MADEYKKRYIGPREVGGLQVLDYKTPKGKEVVKILYVESDVPFEIMPVTTFQSVVSEKPEDWNYVREKRNEQLMQEIVAICLEHDVVFGDLAFLGRTIENRLKAAFARATNYLWTKDDSQWIPGRESALDLRSLLECEQVLRSIKKDDATITSGKTSNDAGASSGGAAS